LELLYVRVGVVVRTQQTTRRGRRSASAVVLATLATTALVAGTACSQPRLEKLARELTRSVPRTPDGTLEGTIAIRFVDVHLKGAEAKAPQFPVANAKFVAQPGARKYALLTATGRASLTDHRVLYARRKLNGPADKRPWVRLEVERLDEVDVPRLEALLNSQDTGTLAVISPGFVLDALHGVLTGSVKQTKLAGGHRAFTFNVSLDKAARELDLTEDERDDNELLRRSIALTGDIFKASAKLRADGTLSELVLHLVEHPDKRTSVKLDVALKVAPPTTRQALWPPARDHTVRVSSLAALRASLVEQLGPKVPFERGTISITMQDPRK